MTTSTADAESLFWKTCLGGDSGTFYPFVLLNLKQFKCAFKSKRHLAGPAPRTHDCKTMLLDLPRMEAAVAALAEFHALSCAFEQLGEYESDIFCWQYSYVRTG